MNFHKLMLSIFMMALLIQKSSYAEEVPGIPEPVTFTVFDLIQATYAGMPWTTQPFISGTCTIGIKIPFPPFIYPVQVNRVTLHQPDVIAYTHSEPFESPFKDLVTELKSNLNKVAAKTLYQSILEGGTIGGGILKRKGGLSLPRFKDVSIYGNPAQNVFFDNVSTIFPNIIRLGCRPAMPPMGQFPPYTPLHDSELDVFWRIDFPIFKLLALYPRTVGPGYLPLPGADILGFPFIAPFFPLMGLVTHPIHAHGAVAVLLRAMYIMTNGPIAWLTGHPPQHGFVINTCGSYACKTFTTVESKHDPDTCGMWQMIKPATWISGSHLDSTGTLEVLEKIDKATAAMNPKEVYAYLHWRCYQCCEFPIIPNASLLAEVPAITTCSLPVEVVKP